jgi:hypothetical protein
MAGAQAIMQAAGVVGNTLGAFGDLAGAFIQKKQAKKNLEIQDKLAAQQKLDYQQTYGDLASLLQGQATYKADTSQYRRAEDEARRQQVMAQNVPVSDQLYREQAGRTSANTFARGVKGAKSGTDLMALAGMVGGQENQQMQNINIDTANRGMTLQQQANQNVISSIANTAAATARERGLEFESILNKSNAGINLARERGLGEMDLNWNLGQANLAGRGAIANSNAAIASGIGGIFRSMGGGIAQQNLQNQQMDLLRGQMGGQSTLVPPTGQSITFWQPSFNAANGYDLKNLASTFPTGWGSGSTPK